MENTNFSNVPVTKPKKLPKPARSAKLNSFPPSSSPVTAPIKGPISMPKGPKNSNPKINPIILPQTPFFEPPIFLVPKIGTILSKTVIPTANAAQNNINRSLKSDCA